MAKKTKKRAPKELTRKQQSRLERDLRIERILKWSVTAVAIVIVGVLAFGFITENVIKARQSVATVAGVPVTTSEFQSRVRFHRMQMVMNLNQMYMQQQALDPTDPNAQAYLEYIQNNIRDLQSQLAAENALIIGDQTLDQLIEEELVRQEAERRAIVIGQEEADQAVGQFFGYDPNPATPTPAPIDTSILTQTEELTPVPTSVPMTKQEFESQRDDYLRSLKVSKAQFSSWFEAWLLLEKLQEQMLDETPVEADQVQLLYLIVSDEIQANEVDIRLGAGEDFEALIDELQADEEVVAYGGESDWSPRNVLERNFNAELADIAFASEVGVHSQPIVIQEGAQYVIIKVTGHEEHELDQSSREQLAEEAFQEWLDGQQVLVVRGTYRDRVPVEP